MTVFQIDFQGEFDIIDTLCGEIGKVCDRYYFCLATH